jgi:3-oxoacyl-[acyl-carrier protein] reductase
MRKAIVTSASKGIGFGAAEYLLKNQHAVGITARSNEVLGRLKAMNENLETFSADHSIKGETCLAVEQLIKKLDGLDTLVLNSPPPRKGTFEELTIEDWLQSTQSTLLMNIEAIGVALPHLKRSSSGRIIFLLSTAAKEPIDGLLASSTLRAGLLGMVKSLSREFAPYGITVNAVLPGYTQTPGLSEVLSEEKKIKILEQVPLQKMALVCDHGALVAFLSEARNNFITGQAIAVDGGLLQGI